MMMQRLGMKSVSYLAKETFGGAVVDNDISLFIRQVHLIMLLFKYLNNCFTL